MLRRTLLPLAAATLALTLPATASARDEYMAKRVPLAHTARSKAHASQDCPDADLVPTPATSPRSARRSLCLHNQIRAAARPAALDDEREAAQGRRPATRADMVAERLLRPHDAATA